MGRVLAVCSLFLLSVTASDAACRWVPDDSRVLQEDYRHLVGNLVGRGAPINEVMYLAERWTTVVMETSPMDFDNRERLRRDFRTLAGNMVGMGMPFVDAANMAFQSYRFAKAATEPSIG